MRVTAAGFVCLATLTSALAANETQAVWKAGIATVVITPEQSMWMAGYAARTKPSAGKVHDLHAKALTLEDAGGTRLVVVTADLIDFARELRDRVAQEAGDRYRLRPESVLLNASHTHCGPELRAQRAALWGAPPEQVERSRKYAEHLQGKLVELVGQALADLAPARLSYGCARAGFGANRRPQNANGPVDHDVPVLRVDGPEGKLRALLFGYACHNTTLDLGLFCGDYAGFAQEYIEAAHSGTTALFMIGCGGDQDPSPRLTLDRAKQHGRALADGVAAALGGELRPVRGPLRVALGEIALKLDGPPRVAQLKQQAQSPDQYQRHHAEELLRQLETTGRVPSTHPYLVHVAQFADDLTVIGLAGEVVVDYSLRLKRELAGPRVEGVPPSDRGQDARDTRTPSLQGPAVWVAAYCNDVFGYVPSRRVLKEGGYEAGGAIVYYGTMLTPFAPSVEEQIIGKVHELVDEVRMPRHP